MKNALLTGILALALGLGGLTATPAQAERLDRDDVGRIVVGVAALALIGRALQQRDERRADDRRDDRRADDRRRADPEHDWQRTLRNHPDLPRRGFVEPDRSVLPAFCLRRYDTRQGPVRLFDGDCLSENYRYARRLPLACAVTVRSQGRFESGFAPQCLRDQGYRMSDRY